MAEEIRIFLARRSAEERRRAREASCDTARFAHEQLALGYERRLRLEPSEEEMPARQPMAISEG